MLSTAIRQSLAYTLPSQPILINSSSFDEMAFRYIVSVNLGFLLLASRAGI